jgi:hypothetical protein
VKKPPDFGCQGFAEHEGECDGVAEFPLSSPMLCDRCEDLRRLYVDRQMRQITQSFEA